MNTFLISNIEEAADMAAHRGNPGLKTELVKGETSRDADLIRRYVADHAAQAAVIDMVRAIYTTATTKECDEDERPRPVSWDEITESLTKYDAAFGEIGPCGRAVIEEHVYRIVEALAEAGERNREAQAWKRTTAESEAQAWIYDYDALAFEPYENGRSAPSLKGHTRQSEVIVHRDGDGALSLICKERIEPWPAGHVFSIYGRDWAPADFI